MAESTRTRAGAVYHIAGYSPHRTGLEQLAATQPGAFVAWEAMGVTVAVAPGQVARRGPCWVLWALVVAPPAEITEADRPAVSRGRWGSRTRHKGIMRLDYPPRQMHGYRATVAWRGVRQDKFFSDRRCGDRLGALAAAIAWRDATERALGKPRSEAVVQSARGVWRRVDGRGAYWCAAWLADGRRRATRYSVAKYGEAGAKRRAQQARARGNRARLAAGRPQVRRRLGRTT